MTSAAPELRFVNVADASAPNGARKIAAWNWPAANGNDAHVVVCVHGLTRQARDFDVLAADLSRERRVVSIDVAGRGQSDWLADPMRYQVQTYAQDMAAVLAQLKADGAQTMDWIGTSMGGLIGMTVCGFPALAQDSPIRRLVLNDVGPALQWAAIERIGSYVGKHMQFADLNAAAAAMRVLSASFGPHSDEAWLALSAPMVKPHPDGGVVLHYDPALASAFRMATEESTLQGTAALWGLYDAITAKTLLLRGEASDLLTRETAAQMAQRGPKAQVIEVPGVGHAPTLVAEDQRAWVRSFLDAP
jgi:pimeloyl-ACP methyl ester carboxylesterase